MELSVPAATTTMAHSSSPPISKSRVDNRLTGSRGGGRVSPVPVKTSDGTFFLFLPANSRFVSPEDSELLLTLQLGQAWPTAPGFSNQVLSPECSFSDWRGTDGFLGFYTQNYRI